MTFSSWRTRSVPSLDRSARLLVSLAVISACSACATQGENTPHIGIASLWRDYDTLAEYRAISLAGDPDRLWVGAAVGAAPSQAEANQAALVECGKRRIIGRLEAPCRLYASGGEIVWHRRDDESMAEEDQ